MPTQAVRTRRRHLSSFFEMAGCPDARGLAGERDERAGAHAEPGGPREGESHRRGDEAERDAKPGDPEQRS